MIYLAEGLQESASIVDLKAICVEKEGKKKKKTTFL